MTEFGEHFVGELVAARFELLAPVGNDGTVWRARDLSLRREVALKEMRSLVTEDPNHSVRERQWALQEARAAAAVNHPNTITVYEVLDQLPHPWLVMELVAGQSLLELISRHGPLSPVQTARVGLDLLGALDATHAAGLLHWNVKPSNVLIRSDGTAVLTDFGIASVQGTPPLTADGTVLGSPEYMAPERICGGAVGPASDLWSLGMLLYVCVEGANPVHGQSNRQTVRAVCEQPVPAPSRGGPLTGVIEELLAREPEQRPSSSRLAVLLDLVARGEAPTAELAPGLAPPPAAEPPATPRRRRLPLALDVALGAAMLITATALALTHPGGQDALAGSARASDTWIAVLAEIPRTSDPGERDQQLADLQQKVPGAVLLNSDTWESLPPENWIVRAPGEFDDGYAALASCSSLGPDQCTARYLSHDPSDHDTVCEADQTPDPDTCHRPGSRTEPSAR
ncbi:serine/threonine-protein kinase [Kitasatospora aureofaciens]|uniref:serine/threonine-protein kinase n=1 Tax=Kitasatospora aureofaciens TaxID=1894 RepID=UPI0033F159D2